MAKINARLPSVVTLNRPSFSWRRLIHKRSVPSFVVSDGPHTTYLVVTLLGERRFVVRRRFSAFLALHDELRFELPRLPYFLPPRARRYFPACLR